MKIFAAADDDLPNYVISNIADIFLLVYFIYIVYKYKANNGKKWL